MLRTVKNRFGSTNEIGVFEMKEEGLVQVNNPSELFLAERPLDVAGSVVLPSMEGTRPILVEVQALVSPTNLGTARRTAIGADPQRLALLCAVLEKKGGMDLYGHDIFLNIAGGIRIDEPALDLGVIGALASSMLEKPIEADTVVCGEVGLAGEIRAVANMELRLREADRLGFTSFVMPKTNVDRLVIGAKRFESICSLLRQSRNFLNFSNKETEGEGMDFKKLIVQSWHNTLNFIGPLLLMTLVQLILIIVSLGILAPVTTAGYVQSLLRAVQEERKPEVGDLFSQMRLFLPLFIFSLLAVIAFLIGFTLLVLPGFVVMAFVAFAAFYLIPLMTDQKLGLFDALKMSWDKALQAPVSDHIIVVIIYLVIMSLGSSLPFAFLITQPMATFILVGAYQERVLGLEAGGGAAARRRA